MRRFEIAAVVFLMLFHFVKPVLASEDQQVKEIDSFLMTADGGLDLGMGFVFGNTPYKKYDTQYSPLPLVFYENRYVYIRGTSAGIKLLNKPHLEVSAFAGYDGTSFDPKDSDDRQLRQLKSRHESIEVGLEARILTPVGGFFANGARDVTGHSDGFRGTAGWEMYWELGDFAISPSAGIYWSTGKYNNYYFGVSESESRKSGLRSYNASSSVSPFLGLNLSYDITDDWGVFWSTELVFLSDTIRDSPMVDRSSTYSITLGIMYEF